MDTSLSGQVAFVTGSSRGIGRAIAGKLTQAGASVIIHYRANRTAAENAAAELGGARIVQGDLGSTTDIERIAAELRGTELDILVNNAGVWRATPLGASTLDVVQEVLSTNILGVFWLTQALLPSLREGARIVNISSVAGRTASAEGRSLYRASKAAVDAFTRNWALELASRRIRVNAVAPGMIETDMTAEHLSDPETRARLEKRHPLGKLGDAAEIADAVLFLCANQSRFMTGQSMNVSGGFVV
ncbi:MAG TPA: SDR family oxidoreductase [Terriglobia bacterium]|jgi:3-oxoacyl-[acyl-carrier protein] reductase|nr:SDR family oxidoreductase [Terriglobia bacterium]